MQWTHLLNALLVYAFCAFAHIIFYVWALCTYAMDLLINAGDVQLLIIMKCTAVVTTFIIA